MPEVVVSVLGRRFTVECGEDEEKTTRTAAQLYLQHVEKWTELAEGAGISQLLLLAGISQADSILRPSGKSDDISSELKTPTESGRDVHVLETAPASVERLATLVERAEKLADALEDLGGTGKETSG